MAVTLRRQVMQTETTVVKFNLGHNKEGLSHLATSRAQSSDNLLLAIRIMSSGNILLAIGIKTSGNLLLAISHLATHSVLLSLFAMRYNSSWLQHTHITQFLTQESLYGLLNCLTVLMDGLYPPLHTALYTYHSNCMIPVGKSHGGQPVVMPVIRHIGQRGSIPVCTFKRPTGGYPPVLATTASTFRFCLHKPWPFLPSTCKTPSGSNERSYSYSRPQGGEFRYSPHQGPLLQLY